MGQSRRFSVLVFRERERERERESDLHSILLLFFCLLNPDVLYKYQTTTQDDASFPKEKEKKTLFIHGKAGRRGPAMDRVDRPDGTNINGWHWEETNKMTFCKDYFESQLNTEQNVSFGEKWFRLVSETFGNKSNVVRKFSISNASVEGECSVSTRKKGKKFGVFDLKVTMQYEVEVECSVKTKKKKKKKRKTWTD